jgi:hypothetical protein
MKLITHLHPVPKLSTSGAMLSLQVLPQWRVHEKRYFTFTLLKTTKTAGKMSLNLVTYQEGGRMIKKGKSKLYPRTGHESPEHVGIEVDLLFL